MTLFCLCVFWLWPSVAASPQLNELENSQWAGFSMLCHRWEHTITQFKHKYFFFFDWAVFDQVVLWEFNLLWYSYVNQKKTNKKDLNKHTVCCQYIHRKCKNSLMIHSVAAPTIGFPWRTYHTEGKAKKKKKWSVTKKMVHKLEMTKST